MTKRYLHIANAIAGDIESGKLRPGDRLDPQREFAFRHGVAASTVTRAYRELEDRGLVAGEVGRGTFVRGPGAQPVATLSEPASAPLDMELNFPVVEGQHELLAAGLAKLLRTRAGNASLFKAGRVSGGDAERAAVAAFIAGGGWRSEPSNVLFGGGGKQALAAVLTALLPRGGTLGVESLTYPWIKSAAARLHIDLAPLEMDGEGVTLEALARAHARRSLNAIYIQPALHNPLGASMSQKRRSAIAAWLREKNLYAVEDRVNGFLCDEPPLAQKAPEQVVLVDSLSKRLAPGFTLGFIVAPSPLISPIADSLRAGAWGPGGAALALGMQWICDGTARTVEGLKRADATDRQRIAAQALEGLTVQADSRAYHLWLGLPEAWRADAFAVAARRIGIAVAQGSAFAVTQGHAPNAVRLALATPPISELGEVLSRLRSLALSDPGAVDIG